MLPANAWDDAWRNQYPVGSTVMASPVSDSTDWRKATVVENMPGGLLRVNVQPGNGRPGGVYIISGPSDIKLMTASAPSTPASAHATKLPDTNTAVNTHAYAASAGVPPSTAQGSGSYFDWAKRFKVGETVWASPVSQSTDWRKATVVENVPGGLLRVRVEPGNGRPGGVYIISGLSDIKPLSAGAPTTAAALAGIPSTGAGIPSTGPGIPTTGTAISTAATHTATTTPTIPNNQLHGANPSVAAPPTAVKDIAARHAGVTCCPPQADLSGTSLEAIFKQTISARYIDGGRSMDVGRYPASITFHNFSMSGPRPYRMPEDYAIHYGSPDGPGGKQGTQVYDVKTKYTVCVDEQPSSSSYKGYVNYIDHDAKYFAFKHYQTGEWLLNQDSDKMERRSVAK